MSTFVVNTAVRGYHVYQAEGGGCKGAPTLTVDPMSVTAPCAVLGLSGVGGDSCVLTGEKGGEGESRGVGGVWGPGVGLELCPAASLWSVRASWVGLRSDLWDGGVDRTILSSLFSLWEQLWNSLDSSWLDSTRGFLSPIVSAVGVFLDRVLPAPRLVGSRAGTNRLRSLRPIIMLVLLHL